MAAQELLKIYITSGGVTTPIGSALDTLVAWIETKAMDCGDARFTKFIDQIRASISNRKAHTNFVLEIYGADDEEDTFVLLETLPLYLLDPLTPNVPAMRYFKLRFYDSAVKDRWRLASFEVTGEVVGEEF